MKNPILFGAFLCLFHYNYLCAPYYSVIYRKTTNTGGTPIQRNLINDSGFGYVNSATG